MPYLSKSGLLKVQNSETYVFTAHDLKVQDSPDCPEVLKYGNLIILIITKEKIPQETREAPITNSKIGETY